MINAYRGGKQQAFGPDYSLEHVLKSGNPARAAKRHGVRRQSTSDARGGQALNDYETSIHPAVNRHVGTIVQPLVDPLTPMSRFVTKPREQQALANYMKETSMPRSPGLNKWDPRKASLAGDARQMSPRLLRLLDSNPKSYNDILQRRASKYITPTG